MFLPTKEFLVCEECGKAIGRSPFFQATKVLYLVSLDLGNHSETMSFLPNCEHLLPGEAAHASWSGPQMFLRMSSFAVPSADYPRTELSIMKA